MKIALITGITENDPIGFETAKKLGMDNYKVILSSYRKTEDIRILASKLIQLGISTDTIEIDINSEKSVLLAAKKLERKYKKIDVLINNAAIDEENVNIFCQDLLQTFETNLLGTYRICQNLLLLLTKSKHGRIVNISNTMEPINDSLWGTKHFKQSPATLSSVKNLALKGLTANLAKEFKKYNVLINTICPGYVDHQPYLKEQFSNQLTGSTEGIIWAATLDDDGPTGGFFSEKKAVTWYGKPEIQ